MQKHWAATALALALTACSTQPMQPSGAHISKENTARPASAIPAPVTQTALISPPRPSIKPETYTVVVNNVAVQELLFALARDAKLNVDIHPGIKGKVTLNAINQTLPQILTRVAKQVDMRYEIDGPNLIILPDTPFLKSYKVDYVNMSREAKSTVNISTQIAGTGGGITTSGSGSGSGSSSSGGSGSGNSNSITSVTNTSNNKFWETLVVNVRNIVSSTRTASQSEEEKTAQAEAQRTALEEKKEQAQIAASAGSGAAALLTAAFGATSATKLDENKDVIANPEAGLLLVNATSRQHEKIQEFLDRILVSAKRQVLIEATVVEVQLSDQYQQGINWSRLRTSSKGINLTQAPGGTNPLTATNTASLFVFDYTNPTSVIGNLSATVELLETFGRVKVLSSPKISALNNQTALLKVVDNKVYFTVQATVTQSTTAGAPATVTYTSTINTVPIGFVMSVTPQIDDADQVTLNVRPTISRITGYVNDPNPDLATAGVTSRIPEIQTREMESIIKVSSGQVAVMGGLMQDSVDEKKDSVPGLSKIPMVGDLFSYKNEISAKSELVIFLRPVVIKEASLSGDFKTYTEMLPDRRFYDKAPTGSEARP